YLYKPKWKLFRSKPSTFGPNHSRPVLSSEINASAQTLQYDLKPDVPQAGGRKLFFDTHAVVRLLEENGFTQQAEVLVQVLLRTTSSNMEIIYSDMVTKVQQEISLLQVMSKIAAVKKDMVILEKSEFSTLLAENEKLKVQLSQLKVQLAVSSCSNGKTLLISNILCSAPPFFMLNYLSIILL
uniref:Mitochondrial calcium uniporter regulator 1 n=1 Tax=Nothobranchius furzeri TaxID=105023 RepID=A0A8C6ML40_NOTFU